ncbi:MAG: SagB family peptide dehydrogenase [Acidobacteria bacterium]|nr:SagB family peptide dehydrogenase [Acidobacteriota bacterium]MBI3424302.1 SagB family peptide dehydrogenase [Acidobacteriota bacterium]
MLNSNRFTDPPISEGDGDLIWETFHENSKLSAFDVPPADHEVLARMEQLAESFSFHGYPVLELPATLAPLTIPLGEALLKRSTAKQMLPLPVNLQTVATLLHCAAGITRDQRSLGYPRAFRAAPSAGALYPLEIYFHSAHAEGFPTGLYHYNPVENHLRRLRDGDQSETLARALAQQTNVHDASLLIFITAVFDRSTFKYGDRGYRFALLEAGHVAQNFNLVALGLGLGSINLGGYYDRRIDDFLDLDGLTHSTIYLIAIGQEAEASELNRAEG